MNTAGAIPLSRVHGSRIKSGMTEKEVRSGAAPRRSAPQRARLLVIFAGHEEQRLRRLSVGQRRGEPAAAHRLGAQRSGLAVIGDVDQDVDRAGDLAVLADQRRRIGGEHHPCAVGPLGERDGAADLAPFLDRHRHRAFVMGKEGAVLAVEPPGYAPAVLAQAGGAAGKIDAGPVVEGDPAVRVGQVDRRGQRGEHGGQRVGAAERGDPGGADDLFGRCGQGGHALGLGIACFYGIPHDELTNSDQNPKFRPPPSVRRFRLFGVAAVPIRQRLPPPRGRTKMAARDSEGGGEAVASWNARKTIVAAEEMGAEHRLKPSLSWPHLIALGVGAIVGTGILTLTGVGAAKAGPAGILSFAIAGLICACAALAYAEMATMIPASGSAYTYSYVVIGELIAWIIGWSLILEYSLVVSAVAVGWSGYASIQAN